MERSQNLRIMVLARKIWKRPSEKKVLGGYGIKE
jgi:hypothetical protein